MITALTKECSICLQEILLDESCENNCGHSFCKSCLDEWIDRSNTTCPLCRQTIQYIQYKNESYRLLTKVVNRPNESFATNVRKIINYYKGGILVMIGICTIQYYLLHIISDKQRTQEILYKECLHNLTITTDQVDEYTELTRELEDMKLVQLLTNYGDKLVGCLIPALFVNRCYQH